MVFNMWNTASGVWVIHRRDSIQFENNNSYA
jgi:hypothetical protein